VIPRLQLDESTAKALELIRFIGRAYLRPLGMEADRLKRPIPPDHELYYLVARSGYMQQGVGGEGEPGETREGREKEREGSRLGPATRSVLLAEEGSYWDRGAMVSLPGPGLGGPPVHRMGTPEQKERFFAPFRQRERPVWAAFAMTEPSAGSDVARITTRARKVPGGYVLSGQKMYSSNSPRAEWVVVFATVDPALGRDGHRAFVVERGFEGFTILRVEKKMGLRAYETASFALDDCFVPDENLLGGEEYYKGASRAGFEGARAAFNATRPIIAAMAVGIARAASDVLKDAISDIPVSRPQWRRRFLEALLEIRREVEVGRLLCLRAAWLADNKIPNEQEASIAKAYVPPRAQRAIELVADLLGQGAVVEERMIQKLARDIKALDIVEGTQQIQRRVIAKHLIGVLEEGS
jgi:acyl-CoA dehydrogenase